MILTILTIENLIKSTQRIKGNAMKLFYIFIIILSLYTSQPKAQQQQINPDGSAPSVSIVPYLSRLKNVDLKDNFNYKVEIKAPISRYLSLGILYNKEAGHFTGTFLTDYKIYGFQYNLTYYLNYFSSTIFCSKTLINPDGDYPSINFANYFYKMDNYDLKNYFNFNVNVKIPVSYYLTLGGFFENQKIKIDRKIPAIYKTTQYGVSLSLYSCLFNYSKTLINPDGFGPSVHFTTYSSKVNAETKDKFNVNLNLKIPINYYLTFGGFYQSEGFKTLKSIPSKWTNLHYGIHFTYYFDHLYNIINNEKNN